MLDEIVFKRRKGKILCLKAGLDLDNVTQLQNRKFSFGVTLDSILCDGLINQWRDELQGKV